MSGAATASFAYDADGKQVIGTVNGVTTYYVGNHYEVKSGVVTKYYFAGATRLAVRTDCLGWIFIDRASWPGPMIQILYEAEIIGGHVKGSDEGAARIIPLSEFPAISPSRTGSQKACKRTWQKWAGANTMRHDQVRILQARSSPPGRSIPSERSSAR